MTPERYARIKELFVKATELDEHERKAFLTRECDNDPDLKSELKSLLEHDHSQTLIGAKDRTLQDLSGGTVVISSQRSLGKRLRGFGILTKHLGARGHLAIGALIACLFLVLLGYFGNRSIRGFQKELRREALTQIVDGKVLGLEMWLEHETEKTESWTRTNTLRRDVSELVKLASESKDLQKDLSQSPLQEKIREYLQTLANREVHYAIWDRRNFLIADTLTDGSRIGDSATPWGAGVLATVFEGKSRMLTFDQQHLIAKFPEPIGIKPHLGAVAPIRDDNEQIIAAILVHDYNSRDKAGRILRMVPLGETGENYFFSKDGVMLSESRFDDQLREIGLIPNQPDSTSARVVQIRDPGGDLTAGFVPNEPLSARPLTKMARLCISGNNGHDLDGYRNYRGVEVVGAWRWMDKYDVGVATELSVDEAEPGWQILIWETRIIFGLFAVCIGIALFSYYSIHRLRQQVGENRRLGQYKLEEQIGEGGMGTVFKAQHELLKRPTAIKLLKPELVDKESIARFEREARLVSRLEHPNTIRIYDYGVTPEGLFYFVMEYLDGVSLDQLAELEKKAIPPARTIFLLKQICYSLREAHNAGLVHRDLKPTNIMACRRGGEFDVVKVLDFGLVTHIETSKSQKITSAALVAGTPQYIAPERLRDPETNDPRSDIYSLGAVAYFLLTGQDFVKGSSLAEVLFQVANAPPLRPSSGTNVNIPPDLDDLVFRCLAKEPSDRPPTVEAIIAALDSIGQADRWTSSQAKSWWEAKSQESAVRP